MFALATLATCFILGFAFLTYGFVAISLRNKFPGDKQLFKRLGICICIFFLMSVVYISLILRGYDYFDFYGYEYNEPDFTKSYISFIVTELNFIESYAYLLKARHGDGLYIDVLVAEDQREQIIPPLTLQMLVENVLSQNSISKNRPLHISIKKLHSWIEVRNKVG